MSLRTPAGLTSTTLLSATLLSLCGLAQAATAPVLTGSTFTLTQIAEDVTSDANPGDAFAAELANIYVDSGFRGVAVIAMDGSHGRWQYTTAQNGSSTFWFDVPASVGPTNALLLAIGTGPFSAVRFIPDADFNSAFRQRPTITVRAWNGDDTAGAATQDDAQVFGDASVNGPGTSYSTLASVGRVDVAPVNDAPRTGTNGVSDLGGFVGSHGITPAVRIDSFLSAEANGSSHPSGGAIFDVDDNALQGVAIVGADSSNGVWQYTVDGSQFVDFPSDLADTRALLLASVVDGVTSATTMAVRFRPNAGFRGAATFTYRAWDQSQLDVVVNSGASDVDTSSNGGTTPYSEAVRTAQIRILDSSPAMATGAASLPALTEDPDPATESGVTLASLFLSSFTDPDPNDLEGVAIVGADNSFGFWQYTTDNSRGSDTVWTEIFGGGGSFAQLLHFANGPNGPTNAAIRFVPFPNFNTAATAPPTITLRAWDETEGQASGDNLPSFINADFLLAVEGATSAFGSGTFVLSQPVTAVNDAPNFANPDVIAPLGSFAADAGPTPAISVGDLIGPDHNSGEDFVFDVDAPADPFAGIAIVGADVANGTWEFSLDGGAFAAIPAGGDVNAVSPATALLLAGGPDKAFPSAIPDTFLRFVPNAGFHGTATLQYRAWDQSNSSSTILCSGSVLQDTTVNGGATPYSTSIKTASVIIGFTNSAPVLAAGTGDLGTVTNAVNGAVASFTIDDLVSAADNGGGQPLTDIDVGDSLGVAVTAADGGHGTWEYFAGEGGWTPFPAVTPSSALVFDHGTEVRFVPTGDFSGTAALTYRGWDGTDGASRGGLVDPGAGGGSSAYSVGSRSAAFTVTSSPFTEITDTSGSGLQAVVARLLGPSSGISVDGESITFVGATTIGGAQASTVSAIDLGTATDGTRMAIPGGGILLTSGDGTPNLGNPDAADIAALQTGQTVVGTAGDGDLDALVAGAGTNDACSLSFSFTVPAGIHSVDFQVMFASEEFGASTGSATNAAAVYVDGVNVAIRGGDPSDYLHVGPALADLFEPNTTADPLAIEYNGVTRPATCSGTLDAGLSVHTIKFVIADTANRSFDSGLFVSSLVGSAAATGSGIVVPPPGGDVAHVTVPPIGISQGAVVTYASLCPSTPEGIADLAAHLAGKPRSQVRGFTWDSTTQDYVELPAVPTGGLTPSTGVFLATRVDLGLDFTGTPQTAPFAITLHPGWNFVGVPPLASSSGIAITHQFPDDFVLSQEGSDVTDPALIATLIGTPGGDIATAAPFFWNGTAYVQDGVLTTGEGYWIKNNQDSGDLVLTCLAPLPLGGGLTGPGGGQPGRFGRASAAPTAARALASPVHDRGVPPPPPGGQTAASGSGGGSGAEGGRSCGLGSGVAAFASMLMLALRRRLREGGRG